MAESNSVRPCGCRQKVYKKGVIPSIIKHCVHSNSVCNTYRMHALRVCTIASRAS